MKKLMVVILTILLIASNVSCSNSESRPNEYAKLYTQQLVHEAKMDIEELKEKYVGYCCQLIVKMEYVSGDRMSFTAISTESSNLTVIATTPDVEDQFMIASCNSGQMLVTKGRITDIELAAGAVLLHMDVYELAEWPPKN